MKYHHYTPLTDEYEVLEVDYLYYPEEKEVWTLSNGDPGYPKVPAEVNITSIKNKQGKELLNIISPKTLEEIEKACFKEAETVVEEY